MASAVYRCCSRIALHNVGCKAGNDRPANHVENSKKETPTGEEPTLCQHIFAFCVLGHRSGLTAGIPFHYKAQPGISQNRLIDQQNPFTLIP